MAKNNCKCEIKLATTAEEIMLLNRISIENCIHKICLLKMVK